MEDKIASVSEIELLFPLHLFHPDGLEIIISIEMISTFVVSSAVSFSEYA